MRIPHHVVASVVLTLNLTFAWAAAPAKTTFPMRQGLHTYPVENGKLILVAGSYQDVTTFRRSYHFYFIPKGDETWNQVPLAHEPGELEFTITSAGQGDETVSDGALVRLTDKIYFVRATKRPSKGPQHSAAIDATWFQFVEAPNNEPDGPAYSLKPVFTRTYADVGKTSVDSVLRAESALKPGR